MKEMTQQRDIVRAERDREIVQRTAELLTSSLSLEELFHAVCSLLARFVDASIVFIALRDPEGARIAYMLENGVVGELDNLRVRPESRTGEVLRTGQPILKRRLSDWTEGRVALNLPGQPQNDERISAIFVPLKFGTEIIGALSVQSVREDAYTMDDVGLLQTCALYLSVRISQEQTVSRSARLESIASTDTITGVANRRSFNERYASEWRRALRKPSSLALLLVDIDFFKPFNDTYGHVAGDAALAQVARTLSASLPREGDSLARFGGEEFVAILPETEAREALRIAEQMREAVYDLEIAHSGSRLGRLTISLGVACRIPRQDLSPESLVRDADAALYDAKRSGRNRVAAENYRSTAPAAHPNTASRNNLPRLTGQTFGRVKEIEQLRKLLRSSRLLTVCGPAGIGKSREAIEAAMRELPRFPDGVYYVDCSTVINEAHLVNKVAIAVGTGETPLRSAETMLAEHLKGKRALLLLDNADQIAPAAAAVAQSVLTRALRIRVLITTREPLLVGGEVAFVMPALKSEDASAMFFECARGVTGGLNQSEKAAVARICADLDYLPRAIRLAAAQLRAISLKDLVAALPDRVTLRGETLRGFVEWSYNVLSGEEQKVLRTIAVFPGGAPREALSALGGAMHVLAGLVEKGVVNGEEGTTTRYAVPGTIRNFALRRARDLGEMERLKGAHARYYAERAAELDRVYPTPQWRSAFLTMTPENDNLRAALTWCVTEEHDVQLGAALSASLVYYWEQAGRMRAGRDWIGNLLARKNVEFPPAVRAKLCFGLARLDGARSKGGLIWALQAIAQYEALGDRAGAAASLYEAAACCIGLRDEETAAKYLDQGYEICAQTGNERCLAEVLNGMGIVQSFRGDAQRARELHEESLALRRRLDDDRGCANQLGNLGDLAATVGDYDRAVSLTRESLAILERLRDRHLAAWALTNLGSFEIKRGDLDSARPALRRALELASENQDEWMGANCVDCFGRLAMAQQEWMVALSLCGYADALFERMAVPRQPTDQLDYENLVRAASAALGAVAARERLEAGRTLTRERALEETLRL